MPHIIFLIVSLGRLVRVVESMFSKRGKYSFDALIIIVRYIFSFRRRTLCCFAECLPFVLMFFSPSFIKTLRHVSRDISATLKSFLVKLLIKKWGNIVFIIYRSRQLIWFSFGAFAYESTERENKTLCWFLCYFREVVNIYIAICFIRSVQRCQRTLPIKSHSLFAVVRALTQS